MNLNTISLPLIGKANKNGRRHNVNLLVTNVEINAAPKNRQKCPIYGKTFKQRPYSLN
jgi:hypothetical protein